MEVTGRTGTTLSDRWGDYPRAYKGMLVPDYPNLFSLYGPNTNIVHGGSIIYSIECQVHYMMQCLALMIGRQPVYWRYLKPLMMNTTMKFRQSVNSWRGGTRVSKAGIKIQTVRL